MSGTIAPVAKPRTVHLPRCTDPRASPVSVEVSCQAGRVRVWLEEPPDYFPSPWMREDKVKGFGRGRRRGYVSAIAEPGKLGKLGKVFGRLRLFAHWPASTHEIRSDKLSA